MKDFMKNPQVDSYFKEGCGRCSKFKTPECKVNFWREILCFLRELLLSTELKEERKWGVPCYTYNGKNVVILSAFKDYSVLSFFKGSLMKDKSKILKKPGENTNEGRIITFTSLEEAKALEPVLREYIQEAIEIEKLGLKTEKKEKELSIPEELKIYFKKFPNLEKSFNSLTQGRKRSYLIYFSGAKQSETRMRRIEKCIPFIQHGIGWNEKQKKS